MSVKKVILVSLLVVVVCIVGAAIGLSVYVRKFSPYAPMLQGNSNVAVSLGLERELQNRLEYVPPATGTVTDEQLARFVKVEERIEAAIGVHAAAFQNALDAFERIKKDDAAVTVVQALKEIGGLGSAFLDAKRAQVEALNAAGFSKDEYEWVRRQLYAAAQIDLTQIDFDTLRNFTGADDRVRIRVREPLESAAADAKRRVEAHIENLRRWRALAFFGL